MSANGRMLDSELAAIYKGRLRKDAAAAWNAMNEEAQRAHGVRLEPMGSMSSYRTYDQQVYLWNNVAHAHDPNWVARPGTSNHGLGLAVDLATQEMRRVVDKIGAKYGFSKACSDAQLEWWHIKFNPTCTGATWKPEPAFVVLRERSRGKRVEWVQRRLRAKHIEGWRDVPAKDAPGYGYFGVSTRKAVWRFQKKKGLTPDGVVGPATWRKLEL